MTARASNPVDGGRSLPWPLIGAAIASMAAFYFSYGRSSAVGILAGLLIASRFISWRLPSGMTTQYGLRAVLLIGVITGINDNATQDATVWYLNQRDTNLAGWALALDLVIRAWSRRESARVGESLGVVVIITALLFAAATNTYDRAAIQIITPLYAVCLLLSLRRFSYLQQPAEVPIVIRPGLLALRACVLLAALGLAFGANYALTHYEYQVTNWAVQFTRRHQSRQSEIGFSTSPRLSSVFNPEPSESRVLLIQGAVGEPHLRMLAYDTYAEAHWLPDMGDRNFSSVTRIGNAATAKGHLLSFTRLGDTAQLLGLPLQSASVESEDSLEEDALTAVRDGQTGSDAPYEVIENDSPGFQGPLAIAPSEGERSALLAIPPAIDPKVVSLARSVAGAGEPGKRVLLLQEYLRSHHAYSLQYMPQGEPLNDFILNGRAAHCQYFASALAIMSRAVGVPARLVQGFYAHETYGPEQTIVRQRDAHAWTECWIDGIGWETFDATPSGGRPDQLFGDAPTARRWWEKLTDLPGAIRAWIGDHTRPLELAAGVAVALAWILGVARWLLRRRRRPAVALGYPSPGVELMELARGFEQRLKERGVEFPEHATWGAHLAAAGKADELSVQFIDTYNQARFGGEMSTAVGEARQLLAQMDRVG